MYNRQTCLTALCALSLLAAPLVAEQKQLKALIIDGQNNHRWKETTPLVEATLENTGRFAVDVATSPPKGDDLSSFAPEFAKYDVIVSNYNGQLWSEATQKSFVDYVRGGGGFVCVHAADNSFPSWPEYNEMIGLGGWGGRTEKSGPYVRWDDNAKEFSRDTSAGRGGSHGRRHPFLVIVRDNAQHPITRGIPSEFMQSEDELYAQLRGPAANMQILATAYSDKSSGGTGEHEPILMVIEYGQGRVFHTTLGHDTKAMSGNAFQITLARGTEWAATGDVTLPSVTGAQLSAKEAVMQDPLTASAASHAAVDFSSAPDIDANGWVSLFNGEDLDGWTQKNGTAKYSVDDRTILGVTSVGSPNSFLCSNKDYGDFELTFEVKVHDELNSGVQIRSKSLADYQNGRVHGPQVEIEAGPAEAGYVYGEATGRGWLSPHQPKTDAMRNGEWNRYILRAVGPRIQTWVNGQMIEDIADPTSYQEGFIGLQVHGIGKRKGPFDVRWRDIRIREIK